MALFCFVHRCPHETNEQITAKKGVSPMKINELISKYGAKQYNTLHDIADRKTCEDVVAGYADMGDHAVVVGVNWHARGRLRKRFGLFDARYVLDWFIRNLEDSKTDLREAVSVVSARYQKMGLYSDKVACGDMFMYVYFSEGYIEISTLVDPITANGVYYCDPDACPVWLKKSGRAVPGFDRIPKLARSSCRKFRRNHRRAG